MGDARQFTSDLSRFADKVELDLGRFRRRLTLGLKQKIELRSPVDSGRLRGSWAVSDAQPSSFVPPEGDVSSRGPVQATFGNAFESSFITSNLPYVMTIEFGRLDGKPGSKQAPQGMVRVSIAELQTELETSFGEL